MRRKLWVGPLVAVTLAALACNSGLPAGTVLFKESSLTLAAAGNTPVTAPSSMGACS